MGADLYNDAIYKPQYEAWKPKFEKAINQRKRLERGTEEYRKAQEQAEEYFDKMHERGYFRDSYNDSALLWKFGLSWWDDVVPMLDDNSQLSTRQALRLLEMLKDRQNRFQLTLFMMSAKERKYFLDRYAELQKFLNEAIEMNMPIDASL